MKLGIVCISIMAGISLSSCLKAPDFPIEPVIEFLELSKTSMEQESINPSDVVILKVKFTDGDGDIGSNDSISDISIIDLRTGAKETTATKMPQIPEQGANNGVSGEILIRLLSSCCIPPEDIGLPCSAAIAQDTLRYEVFIRDRAGNESNHIFIPPILLKCRK